MNTTDLQHALDNLTEAQADQLGRKLWHLADDQAEDCPPLSAVWRAFAQLVLDDATEKRTAERFGTDDEIGRLVGEGEAEPDDLTD
jgi:hypothetical protein